MFNVRYNYRGAVQSIHSIKYIEHLISNKENPSALNREQSMNKFSLLLLHQEWTAKEHSVYNFTKYQERFEVELP